jgi:FkbM family methyltransferase
MNRALSRLLRAGLNRLGVRRVRHCIHGRTYWVPLACTSLRRLLRTRDERYEADFYKRVLDSVSPGAVVFDVGAHLGKYLVGLVPRVQPGGQVCAFEANPATADHLRQIVAWNGWTSSARVIQSALGERTGTARLCLDGDGCEPGQRAGAGAPAAGREVAMTTVDHFVAQSGLAPDLLKIDVEGYELHVLRGAAQTLAVHAPVVCCEIHPEQLAALGLTQADIEIFLQDLGYAPQEAGRFTHNDSDPRRPFNLVFQQAAGGCARRSAAISHDAGAGATAPPRHKEAGPCSYEHGPRTPTLPRAA